MNTYTVVRESDGVIVDCAASFWTVLDQYTHRLSLETPRAVSSALDRLVKFAPTLEGASLSPDFRVFSSPRRAAMFQGFDQPPATDFSHLPFPWEEKGETKQEWLDRTRPYLSLEEQRIDDEGLAADPLYFEHYFNPQSR